MVIIYENCVETVSVYSGFAKKEGEYCANRLKCERKFVEDGKVIVKITKIEKQGMSYVTKKIQKSHRFYVKA